MSPAPVYLLGPQRLSPNLREAVVASGLGGRLAAVTAGWEEREKEDEELSEHLGGRTVNLELYARAEDVIEREPELYRALRERNERHAKLMELYRLRLGHALDAARELFDREGDEDLLGPARDAAIDSLRRLDTHHVERVQELQKEFEGRLALDRSAAVKRHRRELAKVLAGCQGICVAGGHVRILKHRLELFGLRAELARRPVFAWSAGAMVLAERIVLFHDSPPQGPGNAEVYGPGLGVVHGLVPLPHARRRLRLTDPTRVAIFARRFDPDVCVALDEDTLIEGTGRRWRSRARTLRLAPTGRLAEVAP